MPATSYPLSLHDALPIFGLGPDEREQGGAVDVELFVRAGDRHALQRRLAVERGDRGPDVDVDAGVRLDSVDRKSTRLNSSHSSISYAVSSLKKKTLTPTS